MDDTQQCCKIRAFHKWDTIAPDSRIFVYNYVFSLFSKFVQLVIDYTLRCVPTALQFRPFQFCHSLGPAVLFPKNKPKYRGKQYAAFSHVPFLSLAEGTQTNLFGLLRNTACVWLSVRFGVPNVLFYPLPCSFVAHIPASSAQLGRSQQFFTNFRGNLFLVSGAQRLRFCFVWLCLLCLYLFSFALSPFLCVSMCACLCV